MALDSFEVESTEPEEVIYRVRLLGTGAAAPTKVLGKGITVGRTGVGVYTLTFDSLPGAPYGLEGYGFGGATPLALAGCTVVLTTPTAGSLVYTLTVYGSTFAARELAATEYLTVGLLFKRVTV